MFFLPGGVVAASNPLAVVESDTARVSVLPVVGSEVPVVYVGKVALDLVGLRVGPSCFRMDSEETMPSLLDERSVMSYVDLGITLDGGPMEGAPVLEPLEHSVLEMTLDGGPMEGMTVLEPLEHSVLEMALDGELIVDLSVLEPLEHSVQEVARSGGPMVGISVLEPLEHSVPEVALVWGDDSLIKMTMADPLEHSGLVVTVHMDMDSLWMAPWDAGGTLRSGYRHGMAIWKDVLCCVVLFD